MVPLARTPYCRPSAAFSVIRPFEWSVTSPAGRGLRLIPLMLDRAELIRRIAACDSLGVNTESFRIFPDAAPVAAPLAVEVDEDRGVGLLLEEAGEGPVPFLFFCSFCTSFCRRASSFCCFCSFFCCSFCCFCCCFFCSIC